MNFASVVKLFPSLFFIFLNKLDSCIVALPILQGKKVKRERKKKLVLKNSKSTTLILAAHFKQNFKANL